MLNTYQIYQQTQKLEKWLIEKILFLNILFECQSMKIVQWASKVNPECERDFLWKIEVKKYAIEEQHHKMSRWKFKLDSKSINNIPNLFLIAYKFYKT